MKKYLWIGVSTNEEMRKELLACGARIMSGAVSEENLIAGVDTLLNGEMDTLNSYQYPTFPRGPIKVKRREWTRSDKSRDISVEYFNVKYLNHMSRKKSLKREAKKWARSLSPEDEAVVFVYSMHSPFLAAAKQIKKCHKNTTVSMLVLDLPQFMDMNMSALKKILKKIDWRTLRKHMRYVDKYILYSKHMAEFLKLKDGSWTVMEGSYDASLLVEGAEKSSEKISVMYSGVLDLRYGIRELLDAMALLDDRYELWLTGNGNAVPVIEERAKTDPRIKYYGYFPTREELLKKQSEATMLISTRDPSEPVSRYCFPSKIFEYMVSGNPVLSTVIDGIPEEYFDYLIPLPDISPETLKEKITSIADMDKANREDLGARSRKFVLENKNNVAQMKKVLEFIG